MFFCWTISLLKSLVVVLGRQPVMSLKGPQRPDDVKYNTVPLSGPCRDLWRGRCSKYKRGTWNTAFNRVVLLADMCIEMDASVLIQQQMP